MDAVKNHFHDEITNRCPECGAGLRMTDERAISLGEKIAELADRVYPLSWSQDDASAALGRAVAELCASVGTGPKGVAEAATRLDERCSRAEREFPLLAAPDGTVAVPIGDLRLLLTASVGRNAKRQDPQGLGPKDEHAVGAAETPKGFTYRDPDQPDGIGFQSPNPITDPSHD